MAFGYTSLTGYTSLFETCTHLSPYPAYRSHGDMYLCVCARVEVMCVSRWGGGYREREKYV